MTTTQPHTARCFICHATVVATSAEQAQRAAIWHVYDTHSQAWVLTIGARTPDSPRPDPTSVLDLVPAQP